MYRNLRRKDRIMEDEDVQRILRENNHGVLATVSEDGSPYANPVSYVWYKDAVWFHSASQGHKVENIARDNRVAFTIIGKVDMLRPKPEVYFESVIVFGKCEKVTEYEQQVEGMVELMKIFMPDKVHETRDDLVNMSKAVNVYRIVPEHITGKIRKPKNS